jgi:hypothetical protein
MAGGIATFGTTNERPEEAPNETVFHRRARAGGRRSRGVRADERQQQHFDVPVHFVFERDHPVFRQVVLERDDSLFGQVLYVRQRHHLRQERVHFRQERVPR